jgi:hypothetical protein
MMPNDKSHDLQARPKRRFVSSEAQEWGRLFVKNLECEYASLASQLPADATWPDFQRAMMVAFRTIFDESGPPESMGRFCEEVIAGLLPVDTDVSWNQEKNSRRLGLIDKNIQRTISPEESLELARLTRQMRIHCDHEETVPLEGARELHRRLLDMADPKETSR